MFPKLYFTIALFVFCSIQSTAQDSTIYLKADNGYSLSLKMIHQHPDEVAKLSIWGGFGLGVERWSFLGASYYQPTKFQIELHGGTGAGLDGTIFVKNWLRNDKAKQSVATDPSQNLVYKVTIPIKKRLSIGPHFGVGRYHPFGEGFVANYGAMGIGFFRAKGVHWKLSSGYLERKGSKKVGLYLDAMYYFGHNYPIPKNITIIPTGPSDPQNDIYTQEDIKNELSEEKINWGARLFLQGNVTIWSKKGILGFNYLLGVGTPPDWDGMLGSIGAGLSFTFL